MFSNREIAFAWNFFFVIEMKWTEFKKKKLFANLALPTSEIIRQNIVTNL